MKTRARRTVQIAIVLAAVGTLAPLGFAHEQSRDRSISQSSIGGARLGLSKQDYVRVYGRPFRVNELGRTLRRLDFPRLRLSVHLRAGKGVVIDASSAAFRTAARIGPCSTAQDLVATYGTRLRRIPRPGPVSLYRLGNLVFRVADGRVGAVALGTGGLAATVAGNAPDCGA
jgi:hypothetical protein